MKFSQRTLGIAVITLVVIGGGWYWWRARSSSDSATQYVTSIVKRGTLIASVSGSGNIVVDQSASVDPSITGTVQNLAVKVGDAVTKGQLLFTIDNDQLDVDVTKSLASLRSAEQSVVSAKASKKSAQDTLYSAEHGAKQENKRKISALRASYDAAKLGEVSAEQNLIAARKDYANQIADAAKRRVVSPIDGTVNEINVKNGDDLANLSSGSSREVPMIIGDLSTLKAEVTVNEVDIANVSVGMDASVVFDAIDGFSVSGKVEKVDALGTITQSVVTYAVTIGLDTLDERIRPGMSVTASLIESVTSDALIIPVSAIKTSGDQNFVQILENGSPVDKTVELGNTDGIETEIKSGLSAGDEVVTQALSSSTSSTSSSSSSVRVPGLGGFGR